MPFGLRNTAQTFQIFVNDVTHELNFLHAYVDDPPVVTNTPEEHRRHLRQLFIRLHDFGLVLNTKKYAYGVSSVEFLCHSIMPGGIRPLPSKVQDMHIFLKLLLYTNIGSSLDFYISTAGSSHDTPTYSNLSQTSCEPETVPRHRLQRIQPSQLHSWPPAPL